MRARDTIADVLAGGSREVGTHETGWADHIIAALRAAGYELVPTKPPERELKLLGQKVNVYLGHHYEDPAGIAIAQQTWASILAAAKEQT